MHQYRTLITLTLAQSLAQTAPPIVVLLGGIVGARLAPSNSLITLPVALMILGTAASAIPAALFMARFGRKTGFMTGAAYASCAGVLAAYAIHKDSFELFCIATFLVGSHNAFVQQYRFAVVESVPREKAGMSLSILMMAGVVAAYLGPESAEALHHQSNWGEFAGSFLGLSGLMLGALVTLSFYRNTELILADKEVPHRSLFQIVRQPTFILAAGAAAVGYGVMSLVMTATPVSMHTLDHFSLEDTTWVIQSHIMAMYLPSLFSGFLIGRLGARRIISLGLMLLFLCLCVVSIDRQLMHYWWALVLLGVGWNFLFLGGTTLLTDTYQSSERFKVQAVNDFCIFSLQATAALSSGYLLTGYGWHWVLGMSSLWLLILLPILIMTRPRLSGS